MAVAASACSSVIRLCAYLEIPKLNNRGISYSADDSYDLWRAYLNASPAHPDIRSRTIVCLDQRVDM
jgi:hypothetical protein